jgi:hypothetical protein
VKDPDRGSRGVASVLTVTSIVSVCPPLDTDAGAAVKPVNWRIGTDAKATVQVVLVTAVEATAFCVPLSAPVAVVRSCTVPLSEAV